MKHFVHTVADAVDDAGLDFYVYLYDRGARRDPDSDLPAFVGPDGVSDPTSHCLYQPETWLALFERVFWVAERSTEVPIAGVKIHIEHLQNYTPCVCDACFSSFVRATADEGAIVDDPTSLPTGNRWGWIEEHGGKEAYLRHLEARLDGVVQQYERRAHAIVAAVRTDGYNLWQLNMLHPDQPVAHRLTYALPVGYEDPLAYWHALGEANHRVDQWLRAPREITREPIDVLTVRVDLEAIAIPDVSPAAPYVPAPERQLPLTGLRGVNTVYVHVPDPARSIRAQIRHTAGDRRPKPIAWALVAQRGRALHEGEVAPGETLELQLDVPEPGVYALTIAADLGGGPWYGVRVSSHPCGVDASGEAYYFRSSPRQYFCVPEPLESFSVRAATGRRKQEMRLRIWRPDGEAALDHVINSDIACRRPHHISQTDPPQFCS